MLESLKGKRILSVVAHPDDELLGLGGTINRLAHEFDCECRALILGEGLTSRADQRNPEEWAEELRTHKENLAAATRAVGYATHVSYSFPDNRFDTVALLDLVKTIEKEKSSFRPDVIFTHHGGDTNIDHRQTFDGVITATRPMVGEVARIILTFETPSSTEWQAFNRPNYFRPNVFVPVSEKNLKAKLEGMACYQYESRAYPHPRSPEALTHLARYRGIQVGHEYAEAFLLIRSC